MEPFTVVKIAGALVLAFVAFVVWASWQVFKITTLALARLALLVLDRVFVDVAEPLTEPLEEKT